MSGTTGEADRRSSVTDLLQLVTRPSGWNRIKLFGASSRADRTRHRSDAIAAAWYLAALAVVVPTARTTTGVEAALADTVASLPDLIDPLAALPYDLLAAWSAVIFILSLVRRHGRLAASMALAAPAAVLATLLANDALGVASDDRLALGAPQAGVPVQLVVALAVGAVAARELARPFRTFGRRLALAAVAGALLLPVSAPYRVVCSALLAALAASAIRFALGSPITTASADAVRNDLRDLGVEAEPHADWRRGVHEAATPDGARLAIRLLGRDEWDTQLMTTMWRFLWYRNSGTTLHVSARQQIEHHAFLLLLAQARGAAVTPVVAAGVSRTGDALVATRISGRSLQALDAHEVDDRLLARAWEALHALHATGIAHGAIDGDAVHIDADGGVRLGSFERAQTISKLTQVHADRAQLLVTSALSVGPERAVACALEALALHDPEGAAPLVANLQAAALEQRLRRAIADAGLSLEDLRTATAAAAGIEVPDLQKIWRVSWAAVIRLGLLAFVAYLLISQLADIGIATIVDAIREASLPILLFALAFGQLPRVAAAASLQAASPTPVPLGRVTRLQFATTFVNLAVPSTAARVAVSIRFFQRSGASAAGAVSAGALDSISGFLAQIALLGGFLFLGVGTLGFGGLPEGTTDRGDVVRVLLLLALAVGVVVAIVAIVRPLRTRVLAFLGQLREALAVLRSPRAVVRLLSFNLTAELLFSLTMWTVLRAFGQDVGLPDVVIINVAVALFAGLMPVPGGVGVTEGALTAGYVAVGVPEEIAFSAALCYRMCTFYLPPIWGYFAFESLRRDGYL